ncbi:hypothetical protein DPMN_101886 [Dreissena polymorpha]|uniref:Uncharacterized protein n=1 Tax=Dreissena polymorpha TaxID=45954 RepID=A0A9D4RAF9_DREPO|nr:hypothetical protein DPMN_101886 [Dreissena polymorpha]
MDADCLDRRSFMGQDEAVKSRSLIIQKGKPTYRFSIQVLSEELPSINKSPILSRKMV